MFKKLKDKIAEEVKISPQRIQQLTQSVTDRLQNTSVDDNFFSLGDDDSLASNSTLDAGFSDVNLHASTPMDRTRRYSNSSMASDVSFLPRYEPTGNLYHMQSDLDVSASEVEDNASMSSQLGHVSKEQVYSAFQKAQMRYHKYRGRYTDLANHYKILEKENVKIKGVLVETQDKAIRRVNELKEQCSLEQKAKAHLENALRVELDEKQIKIDTLQTKIQFLRNGTANDLDNADKTVTDVEALTKELNDAKSESETFFAKIQELKANSIIFNTKEAEYKLKINELEKTLQDKNDAISRFAECEKENNLKLAQNKMELHTEIQNKDLEIANMKRDVEALKQDLEKYEKSKNNGTNVKLENLQSQNSNLIEKIDVLNQKCKSYESELIKLEQYRVEMANMNQIIANLRKSNEDVKIANDLNVEKLDKLTREHEELLRRTDDVQTELERANEENANLRKMLSESEELKFQLEELQSKYEDVLVEMDEIVVEKSNLRSKIAVMQEELDFRCKDLQEITLELQTNKRDYDDSLTKTRDDAKTSLLTLETKIKEKLTAEFDEKEERAKEDFRTKLQQLSSNENDVKATEIKLMDSEDKIKSLQTLTRDLQTELDDQKKKYVELENNHLELIDESAVVRQQLATLEKQNQEHDDELSALRKENAQMKQLVVKFKDETERLSEEITKLEAENSSLLNSSSENESFKRNTADLIEEVSYLKEEIAVKTTEFDSIEKQFASMQEKLNAEILEKAKHCDVIQDEISLLQEVSSKQQNENCALIAMNKNLDDALSSLKQENDKLHGEILNFKELSLQRDILEKDMLGLREEIVRKDTINETTKIEFEKLSKKYTELNDEVIQKEKINVTLSKNVDELSRELSQISEVNRKLTNDCERLNEKFACVEDNLAESSKTIEEKNNQVIDLQKKILGMEELSQIERLKNAADLDSLKRELDVRNGEKTALEEKQIDLIKQLEECEIKYRNKSEENHQLKEQLLQIENLRTQLQLTQNECKRAQSDKHDIDIQRTEENKRLKAELLQLRILIENFETTQHENAKMAEDISHLQSQVTEKLEENQTLQQNLSKLKHLESKCNEVSAEKEQAMIEHEKIVHEMDELHRRNQQLSSDYEHILNEHERDLCELSERKLQYESVRQDIDRLEEYARENDLLKNKCEDIENKLRRTQQEKNDLERLRNSTAETNENESSSLKSRINDLEDVKSRYEALSFENKELKAELDNLKQTCDKIDKEKNNKASQLEELERHYNEVVHEKQFLHDEIQELKISPLNYNKLDNDVNTVDRTNVKEIESLREMLEQYKSIDKANRSSIEFYENELQKLKVKNEKLGRKLDETLVTLPMLAVSNDLGDSTAVLEYLRNVLFNYMTGKESLVLAKVIAAVCKFDKHQTELILQKEQQRQTVLGQLFGS